MKKLNLGCYSKIKKGYINLDKEKFFDGIDVAHNLEKFPYPFKDDTFDEVYARLVLEHISVINRMRVYKELHRICKPNAIIKIVVPYKDKIFRSPDHLGGGFDKYTFKHLCRGNTYFIKEKFDLIKQELVPTIPAKYLFPFKWLRLVLTYFFNGIIENIYVELRVIKKEKKGGWHSSHT